jgi:hypothetical protein
MGIAENTLLGGSTDQKKHRNVIYILWYSVFKSVYILLPPHSHSHPNPPPQNANEQSVSTDPQDDMRTCLKKRKRKFIETTTEILIKKK